MPSGWNRIKWSSKIWGANAPSHPQPPSGSVGPASCNESLSTFRTTLLCCCHNCISGSCISSMNKFSYIVWSNKFLLENYSETLWPLTTFEINQNFSRFSADVKLQNITFLLGIGTIRFSIVRVEITLHQRQCLE